jgi:hypothetical protein
MSKHTDWLRTQSCFICGNPHVELAHLRMSDARAAKVNPGKGKKPHDLWVLPLCSAHHRDQHKAGEKLFWQWHQIDPVFVCLALWANTGNSQAYETIRRTWQQR